MRFCRRGVVSLLAVAIAGCGDILAPTLEFRDAERYFDESLFRPLWNDLKTCSGLSGSLSSIDFYYVPRESLGSTLHGIRTIGAYFEKSNRIFIVEAEKLNPAVIRHEMMHALLRDESGHPSKYFGYDGLCGYL